MPERAYALTETWKPVVGYEGIYEVSDRGLVKSLSRTSLMKNGRTKRIKEHVRKVQTMPNGYLSLRLSKDGNSRPAYVHRLVLQAFVGPCPPGMETCHNNGVPDDNRLENLRWGTRKDNVHDIIRHGNHNHHGKKSCIRGHEFTPSNTRKDEHGNRWCRECERSRQYDRPAEVQFSGQCHRGHPFTTENTRVKRNGQRGCRACEKIRYELRKYEFLTE